MVSVPLPGFNGLRLEAITQLSFPQKFQSRCQDSMGCDRQRWTATGKDWQVSVPLPGFNGLRPISLELNSFTSSVFQSRCQDSMGCDNIFRTSRAKPLSSFSPVARIQWVATRGSRGRLDECRRVSVPLPGFNGLRLLYRKADGIVQQGFSPVARIQWVATSQRPVVRPS